MVSDGKSQTSSTWAMDGFTIGSSLNQPKPNRQVETSAPPRRNGDYSQKQVRGGV